MRPMQTKVHEALGRMLALLSMGLLLLPPAATAGAAPARDVALVTQLTGEVTCKGAGAKKGLPASAFMKIRTGDRLELAEAASLKLVFFSSGRQETWIGPAVVRIDANAGQARGKTRPAVNQLPAQASEEVRQIPEILQRRLTMTRPGSLAHRGAGSDDQPAEVVAPCEDDLADIAAAEKLYEQMRASLPEDDITPELTLIGLLDVLEQHDRALEVAHKALARQPEHPQLKELIRILSRSTSSPEPAAEGS